MTTSSRSVSGEASSEPEADVLDVRPHRVFPGLVDVHIHGAGGWGVEAGGAEQVQGMARCLVTQGGTAFQPTLAALPP